METSVLLVALYLLAGWAWGCLVCVAEYWLPAAILLQQRIGAYTPRPLYRVARRGRWLAAGAAAVGAAGLLAGWGTGTAVALLAAAVAMLTYLLAGMGKLLHPRVLAAVLALTDKGGPGEPDEPLPAT
jgi:hypothetical protein